MPYNSESRIRFHVVLILAIVTMVCLGAMIYFYTFRVNIDQQKEAVKGYSVEVRNINGLIQSVSDTRTAANMYVITRDRRYLDDFEKYMGEVRCRADSLLFDNPEYGAQIAEFNELLEEKRSIVAELTALFGRSDTMAPLDEVIRIYEPADTLRQIRVTTVTTDTLTLPAPKRRFFRRLADVFSARAKSAETVVVNSSVAVDTTEIPASVMVDISGAAEQVRRNYERQMATIERNVISLLSADQTISSRIAAILLDLQNDVMHSRMNEIEQYENLVRRNSTFSIVGGTLALVAIMAFIVLIVLNVKRENTGEAGGGESACAENHREQASAAALRVSRHKDSDELHSRVSGHQRCRRQVVGAGDSRDAQFGQAYSRSARKSVGVFRTGAGNPAGCYGTVQCP